MPDAVALLILVAVLLVLVLLVALICGLLAYLVLQRLGAEFDAIEKRITAAVMEKAFGMMRNIVATKDAEPEVAHPIVERKLAEAHLFDLAQGRKTRQMIDRELNGDAK
jgi:hypothetical protein